MNNNDNTTSVFLITAMHQLLNVEEALGYFELDKSNSCLWVMLDGAEYDSFNLYINEVAWRKVVFLPRWHIHKDNKFEYLNKILNFHQIIKQQYGILGKVENFFYCQYDLEYSNHIYNLFGDAEAILLDEGNGAIRYSGLREEHLRTAIGQNGLAAKLKKYLFRFNLNRPEKMTFFSAYPLTKNSTDKFIKHNYEHLKSGCNINVKGSGAVILGVPLINAKILTEKSYMELIAAIKIKFKGRPLIYRAHRNESDEQLKKITSLFTLKVVRSNMPIELEIMTGSIPFEVISLYSAALNNINMIFGQLIHCYCINFDLDLIITDKDRIQAKTIYDSYKRLASEYFEIIRIEHE